VKLSLPENRGTSFKI